MLWSVAYAQAATPPKPNMLETFLPFLVIFAVFYFLMIRPQAKKAREQQTLLSSLKRGDTVLTSGGILGTIEGLTEKFITLEISQGTRIKILRSQIAGLAKEGQ